MCKSPEDEIVIARALARSIAMTSWYDENAGEDGPLDYHGSSEFFAAVRAAEAFDRGWHECDEGGSGYDW